jgi:hypothetical protein
MKESILIFLLLAGSVFCQSSSEDDWLLGAELEEDVPAIEITVPVTEEEPVVVKDEPAQVINEPIPVEEPAVPAALVETESERTERISALIQNIFDGKNLNMEDIIAGDDPELNGYISNIQAAPFDNNLLSFEVTSSEDKSIKLILYNIESQFLIQVSSIEDYEKNIKRISYPVLDRGANWHPDKNYMAFYSNGFENRDQIFIVEITDPHLMDESGVKVSRIDFEEPKGTVNHCMYADFNSTGEDLFFTIKVQKESKKDKVADDMNIAVVRKLFQYKDADFKGAKYTFCIKKQFDQLRPVCSPTIPYVFAFVSYKKDMIPGKGYSEYSLNIYNMKDKTGTTVDNMSGFTDYPYQWSPSGNKLFYCKALPISRTPLDLREKRTNIINLQVAAVSLNENKIASKIVKNESSEIIMGDVSTKDNGIGFLGDDIVFMGKFDPYESIFMVDMKKWHANDGFYAKQLAISLDNDFPVLTKDAFLFLRYEYFKTSTVSTISRIFYEPKVDEEALKAKKERREKKKNRKKDAGNE